ncbi:SdpI/YhfL family protein [Murinocardiopsis flavida]|uniref:SdpI/YhfL family protein n=1 Tax=Murinocardiopsis flavida TaxID=645275 RepID=A0A2P8DP50_9ACTN|nr:SdpI family protein [Murinocardiopsis flavida]PSK98963.1 SdpI/YhfL family protein [Murinocardiopsis flavida]
MEALAPLFSAAVGIASVSGVAHHVQHATTQGGLGRNSAVGLRTSITKSSDAAWAAGHQAAAPWLLACAYTGYLSGALTIASAVLAATGVFSAPGVLIVPAAGFAAVVVLLVVATAIAHSNGADAVGE